MSKVFAEATTSVSPLFKDFKYNVVVDNDHVQVSRDGHTRTFFNKDGKAFYEVNEKTKLERWWEYDNKGNVSLYRDTNGFWCRLAYDEQGRLYNSYNSNREWYINEFDDQGNIVHYKNHKGQEYFKKFDDRGRCIWYKNIRYHIEYEYQYVDDQKITIVK